MRRDTWKTAALAALSLLVVGALAIQQMRAELLFFLPGPGPEQVQPIVETGPSGMTVYLALLAAGGAETRSDGRAELVVRDAQGIVYRESRQIRCEDFARVRLAGSEGWRWPLVTGFGWLGYQGKMDSPAAGAGQVEVTFAPARGEAIRASTEVVFPG